MVYSVRARGLIRDSVYLKSLDDDGGFTRQNRKPINSFRYSRLDVIMADNFHKLIFVTLRVSALLHVRGFRAERGVEFAIVEYW